MNSQNDTILVVGGTSGIGLEIVKIFSEKNHKVYVFGRDSSELDSLNLQNIFFNKVDLRNLAEVEEKCKDIISKEKNGIDIIVNSAGIFFLKDCEELTIEDYDKMFDVNVRAPIFITKFFVKNMKKKSRGKIFNIGSSSCYNGGKLSSLYCASKHALLGYSKSISDELKNYGIRVCNLSPSSTKTKMGKIPLASNQLYETFIDPREVAEALYFISKFEGNMEIKELLLNRVNVQ